MTNLVSALTLITQIAQDAYFIVYWSAKAYLSVQLIDIWIVFFVLSSIANLVYGVNKDVFCVPFDHVLFPYAVELFDSDIFHCGENVFWLPNLQAAARSSKSQCFGHPIPDDVCQSWGWAVICFTHISIFLNFLFVDFYFLDFTTISIAQITLSRDIKKKSSC